MQTEHERLHILGRITDLLSGSLESALALQSIVRLALPDIAESCTVFTCQDGLIDIVANDSVFPEKLAIHRQIQEYGRWHIGGRSPVALAVAECRLLHLDDPEVLRGAALPLDDPRRELLDQFGLQSTAIAPMVARGDVVGALAFSLFTPGRRFSSDDLLVVQQIAQCAGLALQNSQLHEQLQVREKRYRDLIEGLSVAIWEADTVSRQVTFISPSMETILGYPVSRWLGEPEFFLRVLHPDDRDRVLTARQRAIESRHLHTVSYRMVTSDGTVRWVADTLFSIEELGTGSYRLRGFITDDTARMLRVEADERRRIAGEIHDDLAQTVMGVLQRVERLDAELTEAPLSLRLAVLEISDSARAVRDAVGRVTENLRPTHLIRRGLVGALRLRVEELNAYGWTIDLETNLDDSRLPEHVEMVLFRVAIEGLRNIEKHAGERKAALELIRSESTCQLMIQDWGNGFDPSVLGESSENREPLGLQLMRERLELIGGTLQIEATPGIGARLVAEVSTSWE